MIDQKVYKTDYISEFTEFFDGLSNVDEPKSFAKESEIKTYSQVNKLRDTAGVSDSRNKLGEGF